MIENATRAFDMAFYAIPFREGDVILTTESEYPSNFIAYLQVAKHRGVEIQVVPNDKNGQVSLTALRDMLSLRVRLVAFAHAQTNNGLVQPAAEVGEVVRRSAAFYLLDACQSIGQMPVDVDAIGCDMLSTTSRKYLRGPRGAGFLWVREEITGELEPPFLDLHAATWSSERDYTIDPTARRFENWESNIALKLGIGAAAEYAMAVGLHAAWERIRALAALLRDRLAAVPGVRVTDTGAVKGGLVTFEVEGIAPASIRDALRARAINVSASEREGVALDMPQRAPHGVVRASVHYYNTEGEVDRFVRELEEAIRELRR